MAQVMMLIGLLLLAFLIRRAILVVRDAVRQRSKAAEMDVHRPAKLADRSLLVDAPDRTTDDVAALEQKRDDLEARVAVLEALLRSASAPTAPNASPTNVSDRDKRPPAG